MKCKYCKRTIEKPLELYDGEWGCPHCKAKGIVGMLVDKPVVTKENAEEFKLSESMFYRWLTYEGVSRETAKKMLADAVEFCKSAALKGHPEAILRLGYYYDKDFIDTNRTEGDRCKIAAAYYKSVINAADSGYVVEQGQTCPDPATLKKTAAKLLVEMYLCSSREIQKSLERYVEGLPKELTDQVNPKEVAASAGMVTDKSEQAFLVLSAFKNKVRAPLCGVIYMKGYELKRLFVKDKEAALGMIGRGVQLICGKLDSNGMVGKSLQSLSNALLVRTLMKGKYGDFELNDDDNICLFFFNSRGGHRFFSQNALSTIIKTMRKQEVDVTFAKIREFMQNARKDTVLYDDDFYVNKKKCSLKKAVEVTIDQIGSRDR